MAKLDEYRRKRSRAKTPEPFDERVTASERLRFVVQRHSATSLHYDLRLERDGVLASWAVPKGLPLEPGSRRRAVHTEDHPLKYLEFEGVIPKGEYGAGTMDVYDTGTYEVVEAKKSGSLTFRLAGERLRGTWTLTPAHLDGLERNWLLIRREDDAQPIRRERHLPMLATLADEVPVRGDWSFEVKWDGYRTIGRLAEGESTLWSRRGNGLSERFAAVAKELGRGLRTFDAVVDGEVCALDGKGVPSFSLLQQGKGTLVYFVFDLLEVEGESLLRRPLRERRERLRELVDDRRGVIRFSESFDDGPALLAVAREQGLEGILAKKATSRYVPGARTRDWLKIKARLSDDFLVAGYVRGDGARKRMGSLVLATRDDDGKLRYAGNCGAGFSEPQIDELLARLEPLRRETTPFAKVPDDPRLRGKRVVWAQPELEAEIEFAEWTHGGHVRSPRFRALRDDLDPPPAAGEVELGRGKRVVRLTNLDRVWWPDEGTTKGDVVEYYRAVAPVLLPHLRDVPFTIKRHFTVPRGPFEWVKDAPPEMPDWIKTCRLPAKSRRGATVAYPLVNDELALLWMVEYGAIDLHVWYSRCDKPARPTYVLFDLDPSPDVGFAETVRVAFLVRQTLGALGLESYVKTSGATGLHVQVPIARTATYEDTRRFCAVVADALERLHPEPITTQRALRGRKGVFVDAQMNGEGMTIASVYSVRPQPGAPVSTPLTWDELDEGLDPRSFTMDEVLRRVEAHGDLWEPMLHGRQSLARALRRLG